MLLETSAVRGAWDISIHTYSSHLTMVQEKIVRILKFYITRSRVKVGIDIEHFFGKVLPILM